MFILFAVLIPLLPWLAGCVHVLRPPEVPAVSISPSRQSFADGTRIHLVNQRVNAELYTVLRDGGHRFDIDPEVWTDEFIMALSVELNRRQVQVELSGVEMQVAVDLHPMEVMDRIAPKLEVEVSVGKHKKIYPSNNSENADHESASTMIGPTLEVPTLKDQFHAAMQQLLEDETLKSWIENS